MKRRLAAVFLLLLLISGPASAGGPLRVTGYGALQPGQPFVWQTTSPIMYTVDSGPLSVNPSGQTVIGYYEIPVTPGTYTIQVENIDVSFTGGSSLGPLDPPAVTYGAFEYWHNYESAFDDPTQRDPVTVVAGQKISNLNFILNQTSPRFDRYEDGEVQLEIQKTPFLLRRHSSQLVSSGAA
jgi:hypothetical protein